MDNGVGIRDQITADGHLQEEINGALEDFADSLPGVTDLRLARLLTRTLEPSWAEHISFQDHVVFPIIANLDSGTKNIAGVVDRLQAQHASLAEHHTEIKEELVNLLDGDRSNSRMLARLLRSAVRQRRRHLEAEAALTGRLPGMFTPSDAALLGSWLANRPKPAFPLSMLNHRQRRRSARD